MEAWRQEAHEYVLKAIKAEHLTVQEAAQRFSVRPRRIQRILKSAPASTATAGRG